MNFDQWWEVYAERAQLSQMDEAICDVCKQGAQAAWKEVMSMPC